MIELNLTEREIYVIAQGLQCLSLMINHDRVICKGDATEETINAIIDTIVRKIADAKGIDLSDE